MKIVWITLLLVAMPYNAMSQILYWSTNNKLQFSDFRFPVVAVPQKDGEISEIEYYGDIHPPGEVAIGISYGLEKDDDNEYVHYEVQATFLPNKSYITTPNDTTTLLLAQNSFDIAELFARKMRKFVCDNAFKINSKVYFDNAIQAINDDYLAYYKQYRISLMDIEERILWANRIRKSLDSFDTYTKPFGTVLLK